MFNLRCSARLRIVLSYLFCGFKRRLPQQLQRTFPDTTTLRYMV